MAVNHKHWSTPNKNKTLAIDRLTICRTISRTKCRHVAQLHLRFLFCLLWNPKPFEQNLRVASDVRDVQVIGFRLRVVFCKHPDWFILYFTRSSWREDSLDLFTRSDADLYDFFVCFSALDLSCDSWLYRQKCWMSCSSFNIRFFVTKAQTFSIGKMFLYTSIEIND